MWGAARPIDIEVVLNSLRMTASIGPELNTMSSLPISEVTRELIDKILLEATDGIRAWLNVIPRNTGYRNFEKALQCINDCRSALEAATELGVIVRCMRGTITDLEQFLSGPAESSVADTIASIENAIATVTVRADSEVAAAR